MGVCVVSETQDVVRHIVVIGEVGWECRIEKKRSPRKERKDVGKEKPPMSLRKKVEYVWPIWAQTA